MHEWVTTLGIIANLGIALGLILIAVGRKSERSLVSLAHLTENLAQCRKDCKQAMEALKREGTEYAHKAFNEMVSDLHKEISSMDAKYARKEVVDREYNSLKELMNTKFDLVRVELKEIKQAVTNWVSDKNE